MGSSTHDADVMVVGSGADGIPVTSGAIERARRPQPSGSEPTRSSDVTVP